MPVRCSGTPLRVAGNSVSAMTLLVPRDLIVLAAAFASRWGTLLRSTLPPDVRAPCRQERILEMQDEAMANTSTIVHSDPDILGGTPVFVGTRVPVKSLYDHLAAGDTLDEFLENFPSVSRAQAVAALDMAREMTESHVAASR